MIWVIFFIFLFFCLGFFRTMYREPRSLKSGCSFVLMMFSLATFLIVLSFRYSDIFSRYPLLFQFLILLTVLATFVVLLFPAFLCLMFFVNGIRLIRREGLKPTNLLSMLFALLLVGYLLVWPMVGNLYENNIFRTLYAIISAFALYLLSVMSMYVFSALLNLFHIQKNQHLDYIIVLGSGIQGKKITPLLAGRVDKGISLLKHNKNARLILSGGQGPGEDIPESDAMAEYALNQGVLPEKILRETKSTSTEENLAFSRALMMEKDPNIAIVTTSYHVFRALLLAKQQNIRCIGFGAKTKWYFTLNATIREFAGYLHITRKMHLTVGGILSLCILLLTMVTKYLPQTL